MDFGFLASGRGFLDLASRYERRPRASMPEPPLAQTKITPETGRARAANQRRPSWRLPQRPGAHCTRHRAAPSIRHPQPRLRQRVIERVENAPEKTHQSCISHDAHSIMRHLAPSRRVTPPPWPAGAEREIPRASSRSSSASAFG